MFVSGDLAPLEGRMSNKVRGLSTRGSISQYKTMFGSQVGLGRVRIHTKVLGIWYIRIQVGCKCPRFGCVREFIVIQKANCVSSCELRAVKLIICHHSDLNFKQSRLQFTESRVCSTRVMTEKLSSTPCHMGEVGRDKCWPLV